MLLCVLLKFNKRIW